MKHLIQLTEWETGEVVLVDPSAIRLCERLSAEQYELGDEPIELGGRTKLIIDPQQIVLVRETPQEIVEKASKIG